MSKKWAQDDVIITKSHLSSLMGVAPGTIDNMIADGRLHPDKFSLASATDAFSLSYVVRAFDAMGVDVPWEMIGARMSQAGARVLR